MYKNYVKKVKKMRKTQGLTRVFRRELDFGGKDSKEEERQF